MERPREPGSARFGNFINYYSFNPPERRMKLIPKSLLLDNGIVDAKRKIYVLDVGCNAGNMTEHLYEHLTRENNDLEIQVLAVDLDEKLIERCNTHSEHKSNITYKHADVMTRHGLDVITCFMDSHFIQKFDMVTCFSITMWVHLNHGDYGLQEFLSHVSGMCTHLLIEPQPWACYRSACHRMQKLDCEPFPHFKNLQWRSDVHKDIETFLKVVCSMELRERYGLTAEWKRPICLFSKIE